MLLRYVLTKAVDQPTDQQTNIAIPSAMLLAWPKMLN